MVAVVRTAHGMAVDQVAAEVVSAFRREGIDTVLLKGPALARWLHPEGGRSYGDTDLLVAPVDFPAAEAVLVRLSLDPPLDLS
jgi:hypothetical protein